MITSRSGEVSLQSIFAAKKLQGCMEFFWAVILTNIYLNIAFEWKIVGAKKPIFSSGFMPFKVWNTFLDTAFSTLSFVVQRKG